MPIKANSVFCIAGVFQICLINHRAVKAMGAHGQELGSHPIAILGNHYVPHTGKVLLENIFERFVHLLPHM